MILLRREDVIGYRLVVMEGYLSFSSSFSSSPSLSLEL